jgi:glycosidase
MDEPIFGTLATQELRLIHHRATGSGLQHRHATHPQDPEPDSSVEVWVDVGPELPIEQAACYYSTDGSEPSGARGVSAQGEVALMAAGETEWDTLLWGYRTRWRCRLPPQPEGTLIRYRIGAWGSRLPEVFADWPNAKEESERAARAHFRAEPLPGPPDPAGRSHGATFACRVDRLGPPQWAREAVIYHIFVDRFHPGEGRTWQQTSDLNRLCGGTLWGVRDRLDYITNLGASCVWLSPIFPSPSIHGYDATDDRRVEPRLGGDVALHGLVQEAHARGVRIVLDLACNHVSSEHPFFREARADPRSPYREWFTFDDSEAGYRCYFGVPSMPEVNLRHPPAREWMHETGRFWLREFGVDGYRLDYAQGPGPSFWAEFWAACKGEMSDAFCFGEVVEPPDTQRQYIGRMDGLLDFHWAYAIRQSLARKQWTRDQLERFQAAHSTYFPEDGFLLPTFLDNHDMDRFLYIAGNDVEILREAAKIQMASCQPPVIYYGTEVGMTQSAGKASLRGLEPSREPMIWDERQDGQLFGFYKDLIRRRRDEQPWRNRKS